MPFQSQAQRAYMYANHPKVAKEWEKETPKDKKLPKHKHKSSDYSDRAVEEAEKSRNYGV